MYIDNDKNKMINSDEMAYLYLLMLQSISNMVMLNTLKILTARRFKKDKQFFVGYIIMYPCHSLVPISDLEIIFHSDPTCKSKDETTHSICDPRT